MLYLPVRRCLAMGDMSKRSTVYFEPDLHQALRIKAASTHRSVSEVVNEAVRLALSEDQEDLQAFEDRAGEATMSYEELLKDLKKHGKL
jgi:plasmid stability protein